MIKRVFLIVLDSFGCGEMPDAASYGDSGSNTFRAVVDTGILSIPNMKKLGIFNIDGVDFGEKEREPMASYCKMAELSDGKDTTIGHWEIGGLITKEPFPTFPDGFPQTIIDSFSKATERGVLCNKPYSGTEVIKDYGAEHIQTGKLIVYTSADSVFQIAAHEDVVSCEKLYEYCRIARKLLTGQYGVARIIARPFAGKYPDFYRTPRRHDFSIEPHGKTILDILSQNGLDVIGVGKIGDIFAGRGLTCSLSTTGNSDGIAKTLELIERDFKGLCFVNLVDFDMLYGHRNDALGYAKALNQFDIALGEILDKLNDDDALIITADHGCDPSTPSTDHSREYVPCLIYGKCLKPVELGTVKGFNHIAETVLDIFGLSQSTEKSFFNRIKV